MGTIGSSQGKFKLRRPQTDTTGPTKPLHIRQAGDALQREQFIDRHNELGRQVPLDMAVFIASFSWSRSMVWSRSVEGRKLIASPAVGKANKLLK